MKIYKIDEIIDLKTKRDAYVKRWLLYGLFGRHKADEGKQAEAYLYSFLMSVSIILFSLSLYGLISNSIDSSGSYPSMYLFIAAILSYVVVTLLWVKDLLQKMKIYEEKIKHLETGEK